MSMVIVRSQFLQHLEDPVSGELMAQAVTLFPCGHVVNIDTVNKCLAQNGLCPLDRKKIEHNVPNFSIRQMVEDYNKNPPIELSDAPANAPPVQALPPQIFLSARPSIAFGAKEWEMYFQADVGVELPLPANILEILASPCPYWDRKKIGETHYLTLVPDKVFGDPLTIQEMRWRTQKLCRLSFNRCYGAASNSSPHWVLMSKDVIPGSIDKSYDEKLAMLKGLSSVPKVIDVVATFCAQFFISRITPQPGPFHSVDVQTDCQEMYDSTYHLKFWMYNNVMSIGSAQHYANYTGLFSSIVL